MSDEEKPNISIVFIRRPIWLREKELAQTSTSLVKKQCRKETSEEKDFNYYTTFETLGKFVVSKEEKDEEQKNHDVEME